MLLNALKNIFSRRSASQDKSRQESSRLNAIAIRERGDLRGGIAAFRKHLEQFPDDLDVINNLGCCLIDVGEHQAAGDLFELAFSLDDAYRPALMNYARHLVLQKRSEDGLRYLRIAKIYNHDDPAVNTILALEALHKGEAALARQYGLRAWLGQFDDLRAANGFLFNCAYADSDEMVVAAEHRFWAETLRPRPHIVSKPASVAGRHAQAVDLPVKQDRLRIAYWSPDFRNHSVRYFFLPLLEGHDRDKFEIIAYYDLADTEKYTDQIAALCDYFLPVNEMPDDALAEMMHAHDLDILVEMAGHTSANRLDMLQERFARLQITGIGYPPTTGLSTIDAKILDKYVVDEESDRYFTEFPMALSHSFWCFDPKTNVEVSPVAPVEKNGFITFGCIGNLGKISSRMLACWQIIMKEVTGSRLLIRSIGLADERAARHFKGVLESAGFDMGRVDILGPTSSDELFSSYNEIDIILDTFPFNGGTTSCFATYMGVPVISLAGRSLTGRMGKSILGNLGLHDWVASNFDEYIEKAIRHSGNHAFLSWFRINARSLYAASALGNGKLFAQDFEAACISMLDNPRKSYVHKVPVLPPDELVLRAIDVMAYGNFEAAGRIIDYCIKEYPDHGHAQVIWTQRLTSQGKFNEAISYLEGVLERSHQDSFILLLNIARFSLLAGNVSHAQSVMRNLVCLEANTDKERAYQRLCLAYLQVSESEHAKSGSQDVEEWECRNISSFCVIVVCDDDARYENMASELERIAGHFNGLEVTVFRCEEQNRVSSYKNYFRGGGFDCFIVLQKNVSVTNDFFFKAVADCLADNDLVGFGGALIWDRLEWRRGPVESKAITFLSPSGEVKQFYEINHVGFFPQKIVSGMSLLDGHAWAIRASAIPKLNFSLVFDPMLEGGGVLLEEYFTHQSFKAGLVLGVCQNLGIILDWGIPIREDRVNDSRVYLVEKMQFDPFYDEGDSKSSLSIALSSVEQAQAVLDAFFQ